MKRNTLGLFGIALLIWAMSSCLQEKKSTTDNVLLQEWTGPYGGVPAFDKMALTDLKPALEKGMELTQQEIDSLTGNPESATFENSIVPLEKSGSALDRVYTYYYIWRSNLSSPEFREIQTEMTPVLSDFNNRIYQNEALFSRIKTVYENSLEKPLPAQQQRTVKLWYETFVMRGADLDAQKKKQYAEIDKELSTLYTEFSNNVLADEENYVVYLTEKQLSGLPQSYTKAAAKAATDLGKEGMYAVTNTRSSMDPFLTYSDERELRREVWTTYYSRGDNADENDNNDIIKKILKLRDDRVALLGYETFAEWRMQDRMARTPENAMTMMEAVWPAAIARVEEEVRAMQEIADASGDSITIKPWDYRYYMEKLRKKTYDLDSDEVKKYLQLEKLREAMFFVAGELFDFKFRPVEQGKVAVFQEDVKVWEVSDKSSAKLIGLWYLDPFARKGKRSGAWATTYRSYDSFDGADIVLAANNSNFIKPAPGEAVLISWDDAETFFHEFGHALHYLSAKVKYPILNSGVRDYTEFQSQLLERWLSTDKVINNYLLHYQTGQPIPDELIRKIKNAATFMQGFKTTEYLASALMDMYFHTSDPDDIEPESFEKKTLQKLNMPEELVMRHRPTHFNHIFSGEGYAAAYYGYMWADVLTSDAAEAFAEAPGGFYDRELAEKLVTYLFAPRNAIDPAEAYRMFRGREARIEALMRDRGFPISSGDGS